jgi:hypothetical protein
MFPGRTAPIKVKGVQVVGDTTVPRGHERSTGGWVSSDRERGGGATVEPRSEVARSR